MQRKKRKREECKKSIIKYIQKNLTQIGFPFVGQKYILEFLKGYKMPNMHKYKQRIAIYFSLT